MTLARGNAISFVAKLSTNCVAVQSVVASAICLSILGLHSPMMERGARYGNRVPHHFLTSKDAA